VNIYVGNLSFDTTEADLREAFATYGEVSSVSVIKDKFSGQSRGFAFVEMAGKSEAEAAMQNLNGKDLNGRTLTVNEAKPREERSGGGGGYRGGGSGGRDGGGGGYRSGGNNNRSGGGGRRNW
jgi:RNA recognition motif-containing protein